MVTVLRAPLPKEVQDHMWEAYYDFQRLTGRDPKAWYLGHNEWRDLEDSMRTVFGSTMVTVPGPVRPEYLGLPIYVVNAPSHFAVA